MRSIVRFASRFFRVSRLSYFFFPLAEVHGISEPDVMVASSGGSGNILYFAARQYDRIRKIWLELLERPAFISFLRPWRVMDVDYLVDTIFKKEAPLDTSALAGTPIRYFIATSERRTGALKYFTQSDGTDLYEILRAVKAVPLLYGRAVRIGPREYFDGDVGTTTNSLIEKAVAEGANTVIAINTNMPRGRIYRLLLFLFTHCGTRGLRAAARRELDECFRPYTPPAGVTLICMRAPEDLPVQTATRNPAKVAKAFSLGYEHMRDNALIRALRASPSPSPSPHEVLAH